MYYNKKHYCAACGEEVNNSDYIALPVAHANNRSLGFHRSCVERIMGHGGKVNAEVTGASYSGKDFNVQYSFIVSDITIEACGTLGVKKFDTSKVATNEPRVYSNISKGMKAPIAQANKTLKALEEKGYISIDESKPTRVTFASARWNESAVYERCVSREDMAAFLRECEHDFCTRCGCEELSAQNTGANSRKG